MDSSVDLQVRSSPFVEITTGAHAGMRFMLTESEVTIGRHPDSNIVIDESAVSRRHSRVVREGRDYFVEDQGSTHGTYLNEEPTGDKRRRLKHLDKIRVSQVVLTFHEGRTLYEAFNHIAHQPEMQKKLAEALPLDADADVETNLVQRLKLTGDITGYEGSEFDAKLSALLQLAHSLRAAISLDDVLPKTLDTLFGLYVQTDSGFIALLDTDGGLIPRWQKFRDGVEGGRFSQTIANYVISTCEGVVSEDVPSDSRFSSSVSIANLRMASMMCVPLIDGGSQPIGILQVDTSNHSMMFTYDDLELLATIASQVSIAIERARLHDISLGQQRTIEQKHIALSTVHNLRQPVTAMRGVLDRVAGEATELTVAKAQKEFQNLTKDVQRLEGSITSILRFARPPSVRFAPTAIAPIVDTAVEAVSRTFCDVEYEYDATQLSLILGDRDMLVQVFEELLYNSCRAMKGRGHIEVDIQALTDGEDDSAVTTVTIEDNGPGIDSSIREQIFDPFVSATPGGTGLGLVFVRHVMNDHRGAITWVPVTPHGVRFVLTFPPAAESEEETMITNVRTI